MSFHFPLVYPILDGSVIPVAGRPQFLDRLGKSLADAGVRLLEYRNKSGCDHEVLSDAAILRAALPAPNIKLILDDRADLVAHTHFDGAHFDAGDISPAEARQLLGPGRIIGTFGGSDAMVPGVLDTPADYFSIGPVFPTTTKQTSRPPIGIEGVRRLRAQAGPGPILVAAAGITFATAQAVLDAGASVVAVAAAIFGAADPATEARRWILELH